MESVFNTGGMRGTVVVLTVAASILTIVYFYHQIKYTKMLIDKENQTK